MNIRLYESTDFDQIKRLFYDTVHGISSKDYTQEQLQAWASADNDYERMQQSLANSKAYVAEQDDLMIGFGNITADGYIDYLYTHRDWQGKGVATQILEKLEDDARKRGLKKIHTHASIIARPFFQKRGFTMIQENKIERMGQQLVNYVMTKELS